MSPLASGEKPMNWAAKAAKAAELPPTHQDYFRTWDVKEVDRSGKKDFIPMIKAQANMSPKEMFTMTLTREKTGGKNLSNAELVKIDAKGDLDHSSGDAVLRSIPIKDEFVTRMLDLAKVKPGSTVVDREIEEMVLREIAKDVREMIHKPYEHTINEGLVEMHVMSQLSNINVLRQQQLEEGAREATKKAGNKGRTISGWLNE